MRVPTRMLGAALTASLALAAAGAGARPNDAAELRSSPSERLRLHAPPHGRKPAERRHGDAAPPPLALAPPPDRLSVGDWSGAEVIEVSVGDGACTPNRLRLKRGGTYRLRLTNVGGFAHVVAAPEFFRYAAFPSAPQDATFNGKLRIARGKTLDVGVRPMAAGDYTLRCPDVARPLYARNARIVVEN